MSLNLKIILISLFCLLSVSYRQVSLHAQIDARPAQNCFLAPLLAELDPYKKMEDICLAIYNQNTPHCFIHRDHARRVAQFCRLLCEEMGLDEDTTLLVFRAALLHDAGQVGEDFEFTDVVRDFAARHNVSDFPHKRGVYSRVHFERELDEMVELFINKGFIAEHAGVLVRMYNRDGTVGTEDILNADNAAFLLRRQFKLILSQFAPFNTVDYVDGCGLAISDLEKALIAYHHTLPEYLTREHLSETFPHIKDDKMDSFYYAVKELIGILKTADTLEATSSRFRGKRFYGRDRETLSALYQYMEFRLSQNGDVSPEGYMLATNLLLRRDSKFLEVLFACREASEFWPEDEVFLLELRARAMSALCDYSA